MKTINQDPMSSDYQMSERGFQVLFTHPNWHAPESRFHDNAGKIFSLPCTGCLPYTGDAAIKVMKTYAARGFTVVAQTESFGEIEQLTLEQMLEMYQ